MVPSAEVEALRTHFYWRNVLRSVVLVLLAVLCVVVLPLGSQTRNPNPPVDRWVFAYLCGLAAIVVALVISGGRRCPVAMRLCAGFVIFLAIQDLIGPLLNCEDIYGELPWDVLVATLLGLVAGGVLRRQQWLAVAALAAGGYLVFAALAPPRLSLPVSRARRDFVVSILNRDLKGGVAFPDIKLTAAGQANIADVCDLRNIRIEEDASGIPVRTWPTHVWPRDDTAANEADLTAYTFPPRWTRSVNVTVIVPTWRLHPINSIRVPVPPFGKWCAPNLKVSHGRFSTSVTRVAWAPSTTVSPSELCLHVFAQFRGYSRSGYTCQELRFLDPAGHALSYLRAGGGVDNGLDAKPVDAELYRADRTLPFLTLEQFTDAQPNTIDLRFRFQGLPSER